jgi:hypothetical protein
MSTDAFDSKHEDAICKEVMAKYAPKIQPGQRQIIHVKSGSLK